MEQARAVHLWYNILMVVQARAVHLWYNILMVQARAVHLWYNTLMVQARAVHNTLMVQARAVHKELSKNCLSIFCRGHVTTSTLMQLDGGAQRTGMSAAIARWVAGCR